MSNDERDRVLNESLIFLSFCDKEGFGLPPAEAMAAGCLVIGYTGVGANEFFTVETGFVVEQNDQFEMLVKTEEVVTAYRRDPAPLDSLRAGAARFIAERYPRDRARDSLLRAWAEVKADLENARPTPDGHGSEVFSAQAVK
jgi:glycosyltransferase involved in cell wall biosynthesis